MVIDLGRSVTAKLKHDEHGNNRSTGTHYMIKTLSGHIRYLEYGAYSEEEFRSDEGMLC